MLLIAPLNLCLQFQHLPLQQIVAGQLMIQIEAFQLEYDLGNMFMSTGTQVIPAKGARAIDVQAVINDPQVTRSVKRAAQNTLPGHNIDESGHFTMGAEDFAFYQQKVPGTFFFVGSTNAEKNLVYAHHHPKFDFDEGVLPRAAALMAGAAVELLNS